MLTTGSRRLLSPEDVFAAELVCREWRTAALQSAVRRVAQASPPASDVWAEQLRIGVTLCPAAAYCVRRSRPTLRALTINAVQTVSAQQLLPPAVVALRATGEGLNPFIVDTLSNTAIQTLVLQNIGFREWALALSSTSLQYIWLDKSKGLPNIQLRSFPHLIFLGLDRPMYGENFMYHV